MTLYLYIDYEPVQHFSVFVMTVYILIHRYVLLHTTRCSITENISLGRHRKIVIHEYLVRAAMRDRRIQPSLVKSLLTLRLMHILCVDQ